MFHSNTTKLIAYWRDLRGEAFVPVRADVDPVAIREVLGQTFMLGRVAHAEFRFRLAGGLICNAHHRNLRGSDFCDLWNDDDRLQIKLCLEQMMRNGEPVVLGASADAGPFASSVEVFLAPLMNREGIIDRVFGGFQPLMPMSVLHDRPIERLTISRIARALDHVEDLPRLRLAAVSGRLVG